MASLAEGRRSGPAVDDSIALLLLRLWKLWSLLDMDPRPMAMPMSVSGWVCARDNEPGRLTVTTESAVDRWLCRCAWSWCWPNTADELATSNGPGCVDETAVLACMLFHEGTLSPSAAL